MPTVLSSRSLVGLLVTLVIGCVFALIDKLTPELKDLLLFAYGAFAASRTVTNVAETRQVKQSG